MLLTLPQVSQGFASSLLGTCSRASQNPGHGRLLPETPRAARVAVTRRIRVPSSLASNGLYLLLLVQCWGEAGARGRGTHGSQGERLQRGRPRRVGSSHFPSLLKTLEAFNVLTSSSTNTKKHFFFAQKNKQQTKPPNRKNKQNFPKPHIKNGRLFITIIKVIKTYKTLIYTQYKAEAPLTFLKLTFL